MINMFISRARHNREIIAQNKAHAEELQRVRNNFMEEYRNRTNEEFAHNNTKTRLMVTENLFCAVRDEAITAKRENAIMRQILQDLTGKSADELIEKHRRATRILEYGIEIPDLPKHSSEDKETEE